MRMEAPGPGGSAQPVTLSSPALAGLYKVSVPPHHFCCRQSTSAAPVAVRAAACACRVLTGQMRTAPSSNFSASSAACATQEAEVMARLHHPNVLPLIGVCRWPPAIVSGGAGGGCKAVRGRRPLCPLFACPLFLTQEGERSFVLQSTAPVAR
jgi:hypothetical protein